MVQRRLDEALPHRRRERSPTRDHARKLFGRRDHIVIRDDAVHQSPSERLLGRQRSARQQQLIRTNPAHQPGQALRAAAPGQQAQRDLGQPEARRRAGHDEVAREG
jgi:hypothetical protein